MFVVCVAFCRVEGARGLVVVLLVVLLVLVLMVVYGW